MENLNEEAKSGVEVPSEVLDDPIQLENPAFPESVAEKDSQLETAIFSQKFYCQDDRGQINEHTLSITRNYIMVDDRACTNILLENVLGASIAPVSPKDRLKIKNKDLNPDQSLTSVTIHLYTKKTTTSFFGSKTTERHLYDLVYYTPDDKIAITWRNLILQAANNPNFKKEAHKYTTPEQVPTFKRLLLIFVNPNSGKKLAPKRWARGKPLLEKAGCDFVEVLTQYSGHARDYVQNHNQAELLNFDGIVTVSGDGLPHEVINGLASRPDWDQIKHIPIGPLPGGSGNAVVKNLLARAGETSSVANMCYLIAKGRTVSVDLTVIEMPDKPLVYSFLSFVWAAMAHIDIESEVIRWMGAFRFDLFGALSIAKMKKYRGRMVYSTVNNRVPAWDEDITGDDWTELKDSFTYFCLHNMPYITERCIAAPIKDFQDGYNHFVALKGNSNTRFKMTKVLLGLESGFLEHEHNLKKHGVFYDKVKAFRLEVDDAHNHYYSIDGERYESKKVQGYVKENELRMFCTK